MDYQQPITELITKRFSCRTYRPEPIAPGLRRRLAEAAAAIQAGPFGTPLRFKLVAAADDDAAQLRGLGTYGLIRGATGFLLGAVEPGERDMEDFGYRMEEWILLATDLELGTCWLGGTFRRSSFADRMDLGQEEVMPCVTSVGNIAERRGFIDRLVRRQAGSDNRLTWDRLFFDRQFGTPLAPEAAGAYAEPLEMVRLGPSASNKQPWRVVRGQGAWHFCLQRTPGYLQGMGGRFVVGDLQRVDLGIALCHFGLTAREAGLAGRWVVDEPEVQVPDDRTEYTASWLEG